MAWGGGTITGGAPMGGSVGGSPGNPGNGLPFAGIPWEMRQGVEQLLADEPDQTDDPRWQASEGSFTHRMQETGISLRRMLHENNGRMILCGLRPLTEEAFRVTRLIGTGGQAAPFETQPDVNAAVAALAK